MTIKEQAYFDLHGKIIPDHGWCGWEDHLGETNRFVQGCIAQLLLSYIINNQTAAEIHTSKPG